MGSDLSHPRGLRPAVGTVPHFPGGQSSLRVAQDLPVALLPEAPHPGACAREALCLAPCPRSVSERTHPERLCQGDLRCWGPRTLRGWWRSARCSEEPCPGLSWGALCPAASCLLPPPALRPCSGPGTPHSSAPHRAGPRVILTLPQPGDPWGPLQADPLTSWPGLLSPPSSRPCTPGGHPRPSTVLPQSQRDAPSSRTTEPPGPGPPRAAALRAARTP